MKTSVCLPGELGSAELDRWREMRAHRPDLDSPFLAPEFAIAVGRCRPEARVAIAEDGGQIVAIFPFERRRFGLGVPIGAGLSDYQAVMCDPLIDVDVCDLLAGCGLQAWSFDHLVATQRPMCAPNAREVDSPFIDISEGFDAYFEACIRYRGRKVFQHERKLGREVGPVRFEYCAPADPSALSKVFEWKSLQYRRTGRRDRFASTSNVQLIEELAQLSTPDLAGTLNTLHAGDRLVAAEFSLRSQTVIAGWFPAHDCEFGLYSTGSICTLRTLEAASSAGIRRYDLGKGDETYKQWFKTGDLRVCEGWMLRPGVLANLRRGTSLPREAAFDFVLSHPRLRITARKTLRTVGEARLRLGSRPGVRRAGPEEEAQRSRQVHPS
jgi:CelD/BcsL family acetyltransferase involved in cellulose biosynthesis